MFKSKERIKYIGKKIYIKEIKNIILTPWYIRARKGRVRGRKKKQLKMYLGTLCYVGSTQRTREQQNL